MTDELIAEGATLLKAFDSGSLLEKIVGKRQSIIFALLLAMILCVYWEEITIAATILGFIGLIVNDYIKDVNEEKKA
jgi:hypothetical protein